jgi:hypothetical protein
MPELQTMVDGLSCSVANRRERSRVQMSISSSLLALVSKEALPFEKPTNFALEPYRQIATAELEFADLEERVKDDLLDIIERYKVIQRTESQYSELLNQVQTAKAALAQAELTWATVSSELGPRRQKAEDDLTKAKVTRSSLILKARDLTIQLIEAKQRFYRFRLNRLRHAWITYSEALSKYGKGEGDLYGTLARSFGELRKRVKVPSSSDNSEGSPKTEGTSETLTTPADIVPVKTVVFRNPFDAADECLLD